MDIIKSLEWRYASKKFDNTTIISDNKVARLCEAFNLTATSYGLQPLKLIVLKNKELQLKMQSAAFNQSQVSTASHVLIICIEKTIDKAFIDAYFEQMRKIRPNQEDGISSYQKVLTERFENKSNEELKLWATKQAYIALGNLLTVCAVEQIDTCPMEGFLPSEVDSLLKLDDKNLSSVLLLPIGYRDKNDIGANEEKVRRPLSEIIETIF